MESSNAEVGCCSGSWSTAKALPPRTAARPQAAPRMLNGPGQAGGAAGEGSPLDSPHRGTRLTQLEDFNNPGHGCVPVPRLRGSCSAATTHSARKSCPSPPPRFMRKAMGDSTQVAAAIDAINQSTGRQLPAATLTPRARSRSKAASKKEVDVVIEIPFDAGKGIHGRKFANGTIQGTSPPVLPPVLPAEEFTVTDAPVSASEQSATTAVQRRRELFLLRSVSTTIGTVMSHLFGVARGKEALPPSTMDPDASKQNPLEVSVEIAVCPEVRPAQSNFSAQSAASSAVSKDGSVYQSTAGEREARAPEALSLTQVVTVKASRKSSKRKVEDEVASEKESQRRGVRQKKVPAKRQTEISPRDKTPEEAPSESARLSGQSREAFVVTSDVDATKAAPKKRTEETLERAGSSFEEREVSSTLREKKTGAPRRASSLDRKGKSESPAKAAPRKAKVEKKKRASSPGGIEAPPVEVAAEPKINVEGKSSIAESVKSTQKHEDANLEEAPLEGAHSPNRKPLKSSFKRTTSSEHLAEMLDVYTKRTEILKSEIKKKGDRNRKKSAEIEVASPVSPEATGEVFTQAMIAAKAESPKADERKRVARDKRKASKTEIVSQGSQEAMDEGFMEAGAPKTGKKKCDSYRRKASKTEVASPGSAEDMDEGFTAAAAAATAESPKARKKPASDKRKASKAEVSSPRSSGEKRKSSLYKQKTDTSMREAIDGIKSEPAGTPKSKKKRTESLSPGEEAQVKASAEPTSNGVNGMKTLKKARVSKKSAEEKPAVAYTEDNAEATTEGTLRQAKGKDKNRKKTSGKSARRKKSTAADGTREAQSPMKVEEDVNTKKAAKMTSSSRKTGAFDVERAISQEGSQAEKKEAKLRASDANEKEARKSGKIGGYKEGKQAEQKADKNDKKAAEDEDRPGEAKKAPGISNEDLLKLSALLERGQKEATTGVGLQEADQKETPAKGPVAEEETQSSVLGKSLAKAERAAEILAKGAEGVGNGEDDVVRVVRRRRDSIAVHRMAGMKRKEDRPLTECEPEVGVPLSFALGKKKRNGEGGKEAKTKASDGSKKGALKHGKKAGDKEPREEDYQKAGKNDEKIAEDEGRLGEEKKGPAISAEDSLKLAALFERGQKEATAGISPEEAEQKETPAEGPNGEEETQASVLGKSLAKAEKAAEILAKGVEGASSGDDDVVRVVRRRRDSIAVHRMAGMKKKEDRPLTESEPEPGGLLSFALGRKKGDGEGAKEGKPAQPELPKPAVKKGGKRITAMPAREDPFTEEADDGTKRAGAQQLGQRSIRKPKHGEGKPEKTEKRRAGDGTRRGRKPSSDQTLPDEERLEPAAAKGDKPTEEAAGSKKVAGPEGGAEGDETLAEGPKEETAESVLQKSLAKAEKAAAILEKGGEGSGEDEVVRVVRRRRDSIAVHRMTGIKKKENRPASESEPEVGGPLSFALGRNNAGGKDGLRDDKSEEELKVEKSALKKSGKRAAATVAHGELTRDKADYGTKPSDTKKTSAPMSATSPNVDGVSAAATDSRLPSKPAGELHQGKQGTLKTSHVESGRQQPSAGGASLAARSVDAGPGSPLPFADRHGSPAPVAEDKLATGSPRPPLLHPFNLEGAPWLPGPQAPGAVPTGPQPPLDVDSRMNLMAMRGRMLSRHGRRKHGRSRGRKGPYAVGDSASKNLPPDKMKFSRIKLSAKQPRGEEEGPPIVLHSPILDTGSSAASPKGGSPVASPMTSVITSGIAEHDKGLQREPSAAGEGIAADGDISPPTKAAPKAESKKSPKSAAAKPAKRKKKKHGHKSTRSNLKPQSEVLSMQEMLLQIRKRKLEHEAVIAERRKAAKEAEHVPEKKEAEKRAPKKKVKKVMKRKVDKRTVDTQTSLPFAEPVTPAVMLQNVDRRFCDFRFTVGGDRVVRGAFLQPQPIGPQVDKENAPRHPADATEGDTSSIPELPSEESSPRPLPFRGRGLATAVAPPATLGEKTKPSPLAGAVLSGLGDKPTELPPTKRNKRTRPRKRNKAKRESRLQKERNRNQRKKKRAPKRASSVAFLFRWRAPTVPRAGSDPGSFVHPLRTAGMASKLPDSQTRQLSRLFSWTTKATTSTTVQEELKLPTRVPDAHLTVPTFESTVGPLRMPPLPRGRAGSGSPVSGAAAQDESGGDAVQSKKGRQKTIPAMQEAVHIFRSADASMPLPPLPADSAGFYREEPSLTTQNGISDDTLPRKKGSGQTATGMQLTPTGFETELETLRKPSLPANRAVFNKAKPNTIAKDEKGGGMLQGRKDTIADVQQTVPVFESVKESLHISPLPESRAGFGITRPSTAATDESDGKTLLAKSKTKKTVADVESVEEPLHFPPLLAEGAGFHVAGVAAQDEKGGAPQGIIEVEATSAFVKAPALLESATVIVNSTAPQSLAEETKTSTEASVTPKESALSEKPAAMVVSETGRSAEPLLRRSEEETFSKKCKHRRKEKGNGTEGRDKSSGKLLRNATKEKPEKLQEENRDADTSVRQDEDEKDKNQTEREDREGKRCENGNPIARDVGGETDRSESPQVKHTEAIIPDSEVPLHRRFVSKVPVISSGMITSHGSKKHANGSPERSHRDVSSNNGSRSPSRASRSRRGKAYGASSLRKHSPQGIPVRRSPGSKSPQYKRPDETIPRTRTHGRTRPESKHFARKAENESSYYWHFDDQSTGGNISESNDHKTRKPCCDCSESTSRSRGSRREASVGACSCTRRSECTSSGRTRSAVSSMSNVDELKVGAGVRRCGASASSSTSSWSQLSSSRSESPLSECTSSRERRRRRHKRKRTRSVRGSKEKKGKRRKPPGRLPSGQRIGRGSRHSDIVRIRSFDRVAENANQSQSLAWCCFLFLSASVTLLLVLSTSMLYFALRTTPAPLVIHTKPETKTYTISTRTTKETFIPVTGIIYYCDTPFCSQEAQYVASVVGSGRRPCVNFYDHVCDEWLGQQTTLPAGAQSLPSRDTILQDSLAQQLLRLIRHSPERDLKTAANLYYSCAVNRSAHATSDDKAALKTMFSHWEIRLWPRTDQENISGLSVWRFAAELSRDLDIATIFIVSVGVDPDDVGATILELDSLRPLLSDTDMEYEHAAAVYKSAIKETVTELNTTVALPLDDFADRLINVSRILRSTSLQATAGETLTVLRVDELGEGVQHFVETLLSNVHWQVSGRSMKVVAMSPSYVVANLQTALLSVPPLDAINYMGFQVFVRLAPYLPERLHSLRTLFSKSVVGRTFADVTDTPRLCLWLVEHSLPGCFSKASHHWLRQRGQQEALREWLDKLESVFLRHVADFAWLSNLSSLLVRYRFKRRQVTQFGRLKDQHSCAPVVPPDATAHPLHYYLNLSTYRPHWRLRGLEANSTVLRQRSGFDLGSELRTVATFDQTLHRVHVPAALFNLSVPSNSSFFVFQLARVAVRFYRGMIQALYENPYEREVPLNFTDESRRRLGDLTTCFVSDAQRSSHVVRGEPSQPAQRRSLVGKLLLDQTSALLLALQAFDELLHVRRTWETDHRLRDLPLQSAQQLFFVYFALDNCESASQRDHGVSGSLRVNVPLRHVPLFADAFNCTFADNMAQAPGETCDVLRSSTRQYVRGGQRRQRGTRPMEVFEPVD